MPHVIGSPCNKDAACVQVCPVDCIHPRPDEPDFEEAPQLFIDPDVCIDCGLCVQECPESAIWPIDDLPFEEQKYAQINADHFK